MSNFTSVLQSSFLYITTFNSYFAPPRKQQDTNFCTFQLSTVLFIGSFHLSPSAEPAHLPCRDPMELIPSILQLSRFSALLPPVVLGKSPQPSFDSQAQITIPALLFLPSPSHLVSTYKSQKIPNWVLHWHSFDVVTIRNSRVMNEHTAKGKTSHFGNVVVVSKTEG